MTKFHTNKSLEKSDGPEMKYVGNHLFVNGAPSWQIDVAATEHLPCFIVLYAVTCAHHYCSTITQIDRKTGLLSFYNAFWV